jgi:hypothetical protein
MQRSNFATLAFLAALLTLINSHSLFAQPSIEKAKAEGTVLIYGSTQLDQINWSLNASSRNIHLSA